VLWVHIHSVLAMFTVSHRDVRMIIHRVVVGCILTVVKWDIIVTFKVLYWDGIVPIHSVVWGGYD